MNLIESKLMLFKFGKEAGRTCGLHYELYRVNYSHAVREYIETLSEDDREIFLEVAKKDGDLALDDEDFAKAEIAESEMLAEIRREHE